MAITQALSLNTPQISTINAGTGNRENGVTMLEVLIVTVLEWFDVDWSKAIIRECAELMHGEYYWLSMAELKLFIVKLKLGHFGDVYGAFKPKQLMTWLGTFSGECLAARELQGYLTKRDKVQEDPNAVYVQPEQVAQALADFKMETLKELDIEQKSGIAEDEDKRRKSIAAFANLHGLDTETIQQQIDDEKAKRA